MPLKQIDLFSALLDFLFSHQPVLRLAPYWASSHPSLNQFISMR